MSVLAPAITQVGLQVLLQPYAGVVGEAACTLTGVIYPAYASFSAVQVHKKDEEEKWLTYWAVYAALNVVEKALDKLLPWLPYYSTLKFAFLLWLQLPRYQGAQRLQREVVAPFLAKAKPHIDDFLNAVKYHVRRPELLALAELVNYYLAKVPGLEWFVRGPDGQKVTPTLRGAFLTRGSEEDDQPSTPPSRG